MRWLIVTCLSCVALTAGAEEDPNVAGGTDVAYDHRGQFGVHAQLGTGYRVLFPYEATPPTYCGASESNGAPKEVCTGRSPFFVELGASYGITSGLEALFDFRVGIERDFKRAGSSGSTPRPLVLAPGVKVFIDDEGSTKFFSTLQLAFDFTNYDAAFTGDTPVGTDIGVRNVNGLLIDFHRTFGVFVHFGETIGFRRWLRFEMDAGVGIQGRYP
jgi:hypothetical protein